MLAALDPGHRLRALEAVPEDRKPRRLAGVVAQACARNVDAAGGGDALGEVDGIEIAERFDVLDPRPGALQAADELLAVVAESRSFVTLLVGRKWWGGLGSAVRCDGVAKT